MERTYVHTGSYFENAGSCCVAPSSSPLAVMACTLMSPPATGSDCSAGGTAQGQDSGTHSDSVSCFFSLCTLVDFCLSVGCAFYSLNNGHGHGRGHFYSDKI